MYDVAALGEYLIDFTPAGKSASGNALFERNPGGAPANVLVCVQRLGGSSAMIGKVGNDAFGHYLKEVLDQNGVESAGLRISDSANTTLAIVSLSEKGDRNFSFYRKLCADLALRPDEVDFGIIGQANIFHFGSLSMTDEPSKSATKAALEYAKNAGKLISYDPNYRRPLWNSTEEAKENMLYGLPFADILKISENELELLTGETDIEKGAEKLTGLGISIVAVTLGPRGCYFRCSDGGGFIKTYDTKVVDTTGSGDAFMGALLYNISRFQVQPDKITAKQLEEIVCFSNAAGALCASRSGAIPAMPTFQEVEKCLQTVPLLW